MTQKEYDNLYKFVRINGGSLLTMDGNAFMVEVAYDGATNTVTYLHGHGFEYFPAKGYAVRDRPVNYMISPGHMAMEWWFKDNNNWLGSNFVLTSKTIPIVNNVFGVPAWEDNAVTNSSAITLVDYKTPGRVFDPSNPSTVKYFPIEAYLLNSGAGKIYSYGVFTSKHYGDLSWLEFLNYCVYNSFN